MATRAMIDSPGDYTGRDGAIDHFLKLQPDAAEYATKSNGRLLYESANGDKWYLVRDSLGVAVVHSANLPAGGSVERIDVGEFLMQGRDGPERQELMRLIGTLVEGS